MHTKPLLFLIVALNLFNGKLGFAGGQPAEPLLTDIMTKKVHSVRTKHIFAGLGHPFLTSGQRNIQSCNKKAADGAEESCMSVV